MQAGSHFLPERRVECAIFSRKGGAQMKDILILVGVFAGWIVLQKYILPRLGINT